MGTKEISLLIIAVFLAISLLCVAFIIILLIYRKRKLLHQHETLLLNEQHAQALLNTQIEMQQQTMQFIGKEIHDNVGQKLTLASLYLNQFSINNNTHSLQKIHDIRDIIDTSLTELRQLSKTLTNPTIAQADLITLLEEEANQINNAGFCYVKIIHQQQSFELLQNTKNNLYRIIQEFIQNSLKHAQCKKIIIEIFEQNNLLFINLSDNGIGFDIHKNYNGIGLMNIQNRCIAIGATIDLQSKINNGTSLKISLKL